MDELFATQLDRGDSFPVRFTYGEIRYLDNLLGDHTSPYARRIREKLVPFLKPATQAIDYADDNVYEDSNDQQVELS